MALNLSAFVFKSFRVWFAHVTHSWEWPRRSGDNNTFSEDDSANFLSFLQTLRSQNGANNIIFSAAVSLTPFLGPDGKPMSDVSGFAKVLDYIGLLPLTALKLAHCSLIPSCRNYEL